MNAAKTKLRPILMSGPMVRSSLRDENPKTQTRRIVKPQPTVSDNGCPRWRRDDRKRIPNGPRSAFGGRAVSMTGLIGEYCPYGQPGDVLWVREKFRECGSKQRADGRLPTDILRRDHFVYAADDESDGPWRPSIHMPYAACRLWLEVLSVRVERVQDISEADAIAEGLIAQVGDGGAPRDGYKWKGVGYHGAGFTDRGEMTFHIPDAVGRCNCKVKGPTPAQCAYRELWEAINGKGSWEANPWVWAIEFKRTEKPQ